MKYLRSFENLVIKLETILLVLCLAVMVLLAFLQVILRNVFSGGILWADTFLRYLVLWGGFLGAAIATKEERQITVDALSHFISPYTKNLVSILTNLLAGIFCFYMVRASIEFLKVGLQDGVTLFENIPLVYFLIIIPIGFGLMIFHFIIRSIIKIQLAFDKEHFNNLPQTSVSGGQI